MMSDISTAADRAAQHTELEAYYGLPRHVEFCRKCVYSNQRPNSVRETSHTADSLKTTMHFDAEGVCDACRAAELKETIDWKAREEQLLELLDRHRRNDGYYDCIVPGSGGKDSCYASHILKYKYGMNPLTVTWPPILYTDYGYRNFRNWVEVGGFDNLSLRQNGRAMKLLTRLAIENLFHPFQTFIVGQKHLAPKLAAKMGIPLIFYGEHEAEFGNPLAETASAIKAASDYTMNHIDEIYFGGVSVRELREKYGLGLGELAAFLPISSSELEGIPLEFHYLGYYLKWLPQESYYYATEHCGFEARPFRTEGTYSKYLSLDDKIDDLNYYTYFIKFGFGRCTEDASQEIRNRHLTREEGCALVKQYDGEFPARYFNDVMEYLEMDPEYFTELCDRFRSPHLWTRVDGEWKLRHTVNGDGACD
jgi:N-acetyl sugar amidotransferase